MEVVQKSVRNFTIFFIYIHLARCQVELTHNSASASTDTFICGTNTEFTCTIDPPQVLMSWVKDGSSLTNCPGATDACVDPTKDNYQFTSNVSVKEFYLTVNPVKLDNAGTFTCSIGSSVEDSKTISIAAVPSTITMTQESGTGTITLQATTDCAYPMSDVSIEWYYLEELTDTPTSYKGFSPVRTGDSLTCTSGDCTSGVGVSKVVSTVTFDEKGNGGTSAYLQAKMVHSAALSSDPAVVAITTNKYIIIEASNEETTDCSPGCIAGCSIGGLFVIGIIIGFILACWDKLESLVDNTPLIVFLAIIIIGFGIFAVWLIWYIWKWCHNKGKGDKEDTSRDVESTRSSPEKAENKLLNKEKQSSATGKADGGNKGKHVSDTQIHLDKSQKVHPENEEKLFRPQPLPPPGAKLNHSLAEDNHGTGAGDSFSLTKLPPIQKTPRTDKPN